MALKVIIMDVNNEKWFHSRRIWGALLSAFVVVGIVALPEQYELISVVATAAASVLGLSSWTMPKNK